MGNGECILEKACNEKVKKNSRQSKASTDDCKAADGKVCCYLLPEVQAAAGAGSPTELTNPLGANATFYTVIQRVISAFLGMVGALALAVFVYAGVMWMTAGSSD
ncbi:pilin, partial [Patescibacteria group bacterium]|nr:pilin [Patescibacteria group bacterium]